MVHAYLYSHKLMQTVLQNRIIEEELDDGAGKKKSTFGNKMV